METSGKTHAQEMRGLRARNRALASEAASLRDNVEKFHSLLKVGINQFGVNITIPHIF